MHNTYIHPYTCEYILRRWSHDVEVACHAKASLTFSRIPAGKRLNNHFDWFINITWFTPSAPLKPEKTRFKLRTRIGYYYESSDAQHDYLAALNSLPWIRSIRHIPKNFLPNESHQQRIMAWLSFKNSLIQFTQTWIEKSLSTALINAEQACLLHNNALPKRKLLTTAL